MKTNMPQGFFTHRIYATVQKMAYRELDILCGKLGGYV
jgi:hypothetical protein